MPWTHCHSQPGFWKRKSGKLLLNSLLRWPLRNSASVLHLILEHGASQPFSFSCWGIILSFESSSHLASVIVAWPLDWHLGFSLTTWVPPFLIRVTHCAWNVYVNIVVYAEHMHCFLGIWILIDARQRMPAWPGLIKISDTESLSFTGRQHFTLVVITCSLGR